MCPMRIFHQDAYVDCISLVCSTSPSFLGFPTFFSRDQKALTTTSGMTQYYTLRFLIFSSPFSLSFPLFLFLSFSFPFLFLFISFSFPFLFLFNFLFSFFFSSLAFIGHTCWNWHTLVPHCTYFWSNILFYKRYWTVKLYDWTRKWSLRAAQQPGLKSLTRQTYDVSF